MKKLKEFVKLLLSVPIIRKIYDTVMRTIATIGSLNRLTSTLYYWVSFLTFSREQFAVLRGRRKYYKNLNTERDTRVELRRNIHRLEKGILMQPRRDIFARDYITETVEFYQKAINDFEINSGNVDVSELEWSQNVLQQYFDIVKEGDASVDKARNIFNTLEFMPKTFEKVPHKRGTPKSNISYDDYLKLTMQRRSVRWFKQKKVPRKLIDDALLAARQSPSACNRLPYEFKIFDDPELVKKVSSIPFGAAGYSQNIPTIIVVTGKLESYFSPRDRHVIYIDASLAAMSFMFALETLGLASSVINWPDFEPLERKMQKAIGLNYDERPIMLLAVGYADPEGQIAFSQKKSLNVLRTYNKIGSGK